MSKLFEALTKGSGLLPRDELDSLLEGQAQSEPVQSVTEADAAIAATPGPALLHGQLSGVRTLPLQVAAISPLLPFDGTHWGAGEEYRILRTKVRQHPKAPQVIAVTSAGPNDGKSVTSMNLAGTLSLQDDARVLLIDADFRRPSIATQLGLPSTPGLADLLTGVAGPEESIVKAQQVANLHILSAGHASVNPAELLDSAVWTQFIAFCRAQFKYIIIDTPPFGSLADFDLIQAISDGTILVVRPDHTDRQLCARSLEVVPKDKLLGVVLNCVEPWFLYKQHKYAGYYGYHRSRPAAS